MHRLKHYLRIVAWQTGLGYLLLWAVTFWALDEGATVFGKSGVCYPDEAKVLFYWVCEAASPLSILASVVNVALTATVWAPVYIAAATAQPEAATIAAPIVILHIVGLPLAIFVLIRMMATALDLRRRVGSGRASPPPAPAVAVPAALMAPALAVPSPTAAPPLVPVEGIASPKFADKSASLPAKKIKARSEFGLRSRERA